MHTCNKLQERILLNKKEGRALAVVTTNHRHLGDSPRMAINLEVASRDFYEVNALSQRVIIIIIIIIINVVGVGVIVQFSHAVVPI